MRQPFRQKPASYADLEKLPEQMVGQILDGELVATPRPASDHALVTSVLGAELVGPFQQGRGGPGGWWILDEPELHFGADVVVPDLAGWRRERLPQLPRAKWLELSPDWVCEVLSPSAASLDRVRKKRLYARERVEFLWYLDPLERTLEALRLRDGTWESVGEWADRDRARVAPFTEVELDLSRFWIPSPDPQAEQGA